MRRSTIIPLRAFALFSNEESLGRYLQDNATQLTRTLDRLDGKQEWTLRIEFDAQLWSNALTNRVLTLRQLNEEMATAAPGKAFLLKKKIDEEKKKGFQGLLDLLKQKVPEVKDVRLTNRLKESAACLVAAEGEAGAYMERILERMGRLQEMPPAKRVLEVNPDHGVLKAMQTIFQRDAGDPRHAEMWGELGTTSLLKLVCLFELFDLADCAAELLRTAGCDEAQGFLILEPVEAERIEQSRVLGEDLPEVAEEIQDYRDARRAALGQPATRTG